MVAVQILALAAALAAGGETVLLDFHAPWCAPCRSMDATLAELEQAGYPVERVNIDQQRSLAAKYNVDSIPTFVLVVNGRETGRLTGAVRRGELVALFDKAAVRPKPSGEIARGQSPDPPQRGLALASQRDRNPFTRSRFASPNTEIVAHSPPSGSAGPTASQDLIAFGVRLTIADPKGSSYGSGTLIDERNGEALVLTCGHIFRDSQGGGQITVDLAGPGAPQKLPGKLIDYDLKSDVGLVSIRPGVSLAVATVAPKGYRYTKGDRVTTVGCNNGGPATAIETRITAIDKFLGPPNVQVSGLPVQGRSGGGLFSAEGQVIGVCNAADPADDEGLYAALAAIHGQLDKVGLTMVYESPPPRAPAAALAASRNMPGPTGDSPLPSERVGRGVLPAPIDAQAAALGALNQAERAALAEVQKRGDGAEVICIVRSLSDPRAKSEVIMLDRASSAFLKQLAADRKAQGGRHLTSLQVPGR
jgi:thiol-disulfide isomerase/thioredoxin